MLGMTTIRIGSMPRRHCPRAAASSAVIAQVGCSSSMFFNTTSGNRPRSASKTSCRSTPSREITTNAVRSPPTMPVQHTSLHRIPRHAIRSRTSRRPRRSRRTASGRPADESIRMMARLDIAAADHRRMQCHHDCHRSSAPYACGRSACERPPVAIVPRSACCHAPFKASLGQDHRPT